MAARSTAGGGGEHDHAGEGVETTDDEPEGSRAGAERADLDGPGTEPVGEGVEAAGPVLGVLPGHHAHRDSIGVGGRRGPLQPGDVPVAVEPAPHPHSIIAVRHGAP